MEQNRKRERWIEKKEENREKDGRSERWMKFEGSLAISLCGCRTVRGAYCLLLAVCACMCVSHRRIQVSESNWAELSCKLGGGDCSQHFETQLWFSRILCGSISTRNSDGSYSIVSIKHKFERKIKQDNGETGGWGTVGVREQETD